MNILLVNDDGIRSNGLRQLAQRLAQDGHCVYVVAPDGQRSGYSHFLTIHNAVAIQKIQNFTGAKVALACSGTPSDCVKYALHEIIQPLQCDLVISGPNKGENVGYDMLYSGTVGGAEEGALYGVKSIALSQWNTDDSFDTCINVFMRLLPKLMQFDYKQTVININVPNCDKEQIKGVKVVKQGGRIFKDYYEQIDSEHWQLCGNVDISKENNTDAYWSLQDYVTITPIKLDRTDYAVLAELEKLIRI